LLSHGLISDFFTGGSQLFWPVSNAWLGALNLDVSGHINVVLKLGLFCLTLPIMYKLGDLQTLLKPKNKSGALIIPLVATWGPLLAVGRGQEGALPTLLVIPSLFCAGLFVYSPFVFLRAGQLKDKDKQQPKVAVSDFSSNRVS
jgi:hypothetical protein